MESCPIPYFADAGRVEAIRMALVTWYRANKRDLPWRGADPYGVWVSEIMLQQTLVAAVIPYYLRFMSRFPTVYALADAPVEDVLHCWSGLGYYARARNLHRAAKTLVLDHGGCIPNTREAILKLPGIGRYTAGAILSIAYNQQYAAVDANAVRVLCRLFEIGGDPKSSSTQLEIQKSADLLVPQDNPGEFNQAVMELGATICDGADPGCNQCPVLTCCSAGSSSDPTRFPRYAETRAATNVTHSCIVIKNDANAVLIIRRPPHGLWGGLWEFPRVVCTSGEPPINGAIRAADEITGISHTAPTLLTTVKHTVTRFKITLHAFVASVCTSETNVCGKLQGFSDEISNSHAWVLPEDIAGYPFSSPQVRVVKSILGKGGG